MDNLDTPGPVLPATPCKLYSGEWGARVQGSPVVGTVVEIETRRGTSWKARVTAVHHSDATGAVCSTESLDPKPAKPARGRGRGRRGSSYTRFSSGAEVYQNRNGRCEDAPCCGCCS